MSLETDAEVGRQAELLLDNPIYKEAIESVREVIIQTWEKCPVRDTEAQHELKLMLKLLKDLEANINHVATTGKLAKLQIEQERRGLRSFFRVA
jgi:hypothetical protein